MKNTKTTEAKVKLIAELIVKAHESMNQALELIDDSVAAHVIKVGRESNYDDETTNIILSFGDDLHDYSGGFSDVIHFANV